MSNTLGEAPDEMPEELQMEEERKRIETEATNWDPEKEAYERQQTSHKTVICYNSSCPDYRRERPAHENCACKRTKILGGGV